MEKTALQQLIDKWEREKGSYIPNAPIFQCFIDDAKSMLPVEKRQMIEFADKYADSDAFYCSGEFDIEKDAEQYYNETFKSE